MLRPKPFWLAALAATGFTVLSLLGSPSAHAGEVTPVLGVDGVLTLTGSPANDRLTISGTPERIVVLAQLGTRLPSERRFGGGRFAIFEGVTGVIFDGQGGNDNLQITAGVGTFSYLGGEGNETLLADLALAGDVQVNMGGGDDRVILKAAAANMLQIDLGDGTNTLSLSDTVVSVLSIVSGSGSDQILLNRVNGIPMVGVDLSVSSGAGNDLVGFQACLLRAADPMTPAFLDGGDGDDDQLAQVDSTLDPLPMPLNFEVVVGFDPPPPPPPPPLKTRRGR